MSPKRNGTTKRTWHESLGCIPRLGATKQNMENIGQFDQEILSYIRRKIADGADDKSIKAEILLDARFIALSSDSQTAEAYIEFARRAKTPR